MLRGPGKSAILSADQTRNPIQMMRKHVATMLMLAMAVAAPSARAERREVDSAEALQAAVAAAKPGDQIVLADGVYQGLRVTVKGMGTEDAPITVCAQTPGGVVLGGTAAIRIQGEYLVVSGFVFDQVWQGSSIVTFDKARHCRLAECVFVECGDPDNTFRHIVTLRNGSCHNQLDHCFMTGSLSMGMGIAVGTETTRNTDNRIDHNWYKDIRRRSNNGQEVIQLANEGRTVDVRTLVEYCLFEATNGDAEIISDKSCSNTIRYNTFRNSSSQLVLRDGSRTLVQGNIFLNTGGIRVHGDHHRILGNYLAGCRNAAIVMPGGGWIKDGLHLYMNVEDCLVADNTIVDAGRAGLDVGGPNPHPAVVRRQEMCNNRYERNLVVGAKGTLIQDGGSLNSTWIGNVRVPAGTAAAGLEDGGIREAQIALTEADGCLFPPAGFGAGCTREALGTYGRPLLPADVGPTWLKGDLARLHRVPNPLPVPGYKEREKQMFGLRSPTAPLLRPEANAAGTYTVQLEACLVSDGAVVVELAAGVRGVRFPKVDSRAEARLALPPGTYKATIYAYATGSDADAFHLVVGEARIRTYPEQTNTVAPGKATLSFTVKTAEPVPLVVVPAESGVAVDRIEITPLARK